MSFWARLLGDHLGITANANVPAPAPGTVSEPDWTPGDPNGLEVQGEDTFSRSLPFPSPSPWSGWPAEWATPNWQMGIRKLVDTAWACLDLNASVLATMPVYRLQSGRIVEPLTWMSNPDPLIYSSWYEFAKQLFWDYQMGEAFVLPMARRADGFPLSFRVVPPWLVSVEMDSGRRRYRLGSLDVTDDILHIRYQSTSDDAHGHGPLEFSGARMVAADVLSRYATNLASTGGTTKEWLVVEKLLDRKQSNDLLDQWIEARADHLGLPGVLSGGAELKQSQQMNARDMALLELAQFTEARIAIMLGVPPFLVGLPSGGDSMTYSNVSSLFDFHDRSSLRPKAAAVMAALSGWALPRGQSVELNRDEYSRPALLDRAQAYEKLAGIGAMSPEEVRTMERLTGDAPDAAPDLAASALTGGDDGGG